jgi:serine/threonine protein phosphatase PrpC
VFISLY